MPSPPFDLVSWLLAACAFVAVGALVVAVVAIARLGPLLGRAGDEDTRRGAPAGEPRG
ncbi:MAG TPA: hypothetical protein PKC20_02680 [Burkholderiaceae bacterium]|nr:hypothetical protein [Burkholderiaceae bacterium]